MDISNSLLIASRIVILIMCSWSIPFSEYTNQRPGFISSSFHFCQMWIASWIWASTAFSIFGLFFLAVMSFSFSKHPETLELESFFSTPSTSDFLSYNSHQTWMAPGGVRIANQKIGFPFSLMSYSFWGSFHHCQKIHPIYSSSIIHCSPFFSIAAMGMVNLNTVPMAYRLCFANKKCWQDLPYEEARFQSIHESSPLAAAPLSKKQQVTLFFFVFWLPKHSYLQRQIRRRCISSEKFFECTRKIKNLHGAFAATLSASIHLRHDWVLDHALATHDHAPIGNRNHLSPRSKALKYKTQQLLLPLRVEMKESTDFRTWYTPSAELSLQTFEWCIILCRSRCLLLNHLFLLHNL